METTTLNPQYIYVQTTEPSDKTVGKIWYNTTDNKVYVSDGATYDLIADVDFGTIEVQQLEQDINILINSASASSTLNDFSDIYLDIFSDATGFSNTIDTGNTDATYSAGAYINYTSTNQGSGESQSVICDQSGYGGFYITTTSAVSISGLTTYAGNEATKCYIFNTSDEKIGEGNISGNVGTFAPAIELDDATDYKIVVDKGGSDYAHTYSGDASYPYNKTGYNLIKGCSNSLNSYLTGRIFEVDTIQSSPVGASKFVQTNAIPITANPTNHQVYSKNYLGGTATATYNISFDGGTTWITDQPFNTKNQDVHAGSSMIIKLNLEGVGTNNTNIIKNYASMLYY